MITDKKIHPYSAFPRETVTVLSLGSIGISQAAVLFGAIIPYQGFPSGQPPYAIYGWQIENVQVFCTAIVATAQIDVQIAAVTVLTGLITPVAGTVVQGVLVANKALLRGKLTDQLNAKATTNGTGTLTNISVTVTLRPFPMSNEA